MVKSRYSKTVPKLGELGKVCHGAGVMIPDVEALRVPLPKRTAQTQILLILGVWSQPLYRKRAFIPVTQIVALLVFSLAWLLLPLAAALRLACAAVTPRGRRATGRG